MNNKVVQLLIMAIIFVPLFTTCQKEISSEHADYIGTWIVSDYYSEDFGNTLTINSDGSGSYQENKLINDRLIEGKIKIKDDKLKISPSIGSITFEITQEPLKEQANSTNYNWTMILDNTTYTKNPYYEIDYEYTCSNGVRDNGETGVDCGGDYCGTCPTCSDLIQNQNETGVDCGGPCSACNDPECLDTITNNTSFTEFCSGTQNPNRFYQYYSGTSSNNYGSYFIIYASYGEWEMYIRLPEYPTENRAYNLDSEYNDIYYTNPDIASIELTRYVSSYDYLFSVSGRIYIEVDGSSAIATFCDIEFESTTSSCMNGSGKLTFYNY